MRGYKSHSTNNNLFDCIQSYENGKNTQKYYCEKYNINYKLFMRYYAKYKKTVMNGGNINDIKKPNNKKKINEKSSISTQQNKNQNDILKIFDKNHQDEQKQKDKEEKKLLKEENQLLQNKIKEQNKRKNVQSLNDIIPNYKKDYDIKNI